MKINNISFKNLLSYGNNITKYQFNGATETTLLSGPNGSGKTSLIDALYYNLTGKAYRKITLAQLINTKNKKDLYTRGEYESSTGTIIKIERGRIPGIFKLWIDDVEQDQDSSKDFQTRIETILEFNPKNLRKLFLISTTSYKPFLSMSAEEKRQLIDELIEIENFSRMSDKMKKDRTLNKEELKVVQFQIDKLNSNVKLVEDMNKSIDESVEDNTKEINDDMLGIKKEALKYKDNKITLLEKIDKLNIAIIDQKEKEFKQSEVINNLKNTITVESNLMFARRDELGKQSEVFLDDTCITCSQSITDEHKQNMTWELEKEYFKLDDWDIKIENEKARLKRYQKSNEKFNGTIDINNKLITKMRSDVQNIAKFQSNLKSEYLVLDQKKKSISETIKRNQEDKKDVSDLLKQLNEQYNLKGEITKQLDVIDTAIKLMGEKYLRSHMIEKYLPILNVSLNKYLEVFGLPFNITLDKEFKEILHDKNYEKLSYHSLSEGEKFRVDLSMLFSFFDLTKTRSKLTSNVLVMDEVADGSADDEAINGLAEIVQQLKEEGINVVLISHNPKTKDIIEFDKTINIRKLGTFSIIREE